VLLNVYDLNSLWFTGWVTSQAPLAVLCAGAASDTACFISVFIPDASLGQFFWQLSWQFSVSGDTAETETRSQQRCVLFIPAAEQPRTKLGHLSGVTAAASSASIPFSLARRVLSTAGT